MTTTAIPVKTKQADLLTGETKKEIGPGEKMKALVYLGPGKKSWEEKPKPLINQPTDALVKIL